MNDDYLYSIETYLNPEVFAKESLLEELSGHLVGGRLVLIRDAFQKAFADRVHACLERFTEWRVYERFQGKFHYHHHNIYDESLYPVDLEWCRRIFSSAPTKRLIESLSQRPCEAQTVFSASRYMPGDYSLPHTDLVECEQEVRQVAFVWHLTRDWQDDWGGDLFWCPSNSYVTPGYNNLLLFNVSSESLHCVTHVSPYAQSKRLTINGWWTSRKVVLEKTQRPSSLRLSSKVEVI